jgi:hypothetical protein
MIRGKLSGRPREYLDTIIVRQKNRNMEGYAYWPVHGPYIKNGEIWGNYVSSSNSLTGAVKSIELQKKPLSGECMLTIDDRITLLEVGMDGLEVSHSRIRTK